MPDPIIDQDPGDESDGKGTLCGYCRENAPLSEADLCEDCLMEAIGDVLLESALEESAVPQ